MTEFNVLGVVLAMWPVISSTVALYTATKVGRAADLLLHELEVEEMIYREILINLLSSDVPEADLIQLIDGPKPNLGPWKDKALHTSLERRLGTKSQVVLEILKEMENTITTLNEKLKTDGTVFLVWLYSLK